MDHTAEFRVSDRGQMALPSAVRRRWNLLDGGAVEVTDLGGAVLITPLGGTSLQQLLGQAIDEAGGYEQLVHDVIADEPDLA